MTGLLAAAALPRALHPGAWWLWALGLAAAASRTTNPFLLMLILGVAATVVSLRRPDAPWARSFTVFLKLGLVVIAIRVVAQTVLSAPLPGTVLLRLPQIPTPSWAVGVSIGGPITAEVLASAVYSGLRLATVLACIGAANALANPKRLLASLPAALYELGVAVVVALSFAPQLVASVGRVREARRLRGRPDRGLRSLVGVALPVLEDALERSVALAAAMDSRGYGRQAPVSPTVRRLTAALTLGGLLGAAAGLYGLLDGSQAGWRGLPLLLAGTGLAVAGLLLGGRRTARTRYRPDPFGTPELLTAAAGLVAALGVIVGGATAGPAALHPTTFPLLWPALPALPAVAVLVAGLPAWLTPAPPSSAAEARA